MNFYFILIIFIINFNFLKLKIEINQLNPSLKITLVPLPFNNIK